MEGWIVATGIDVGLSEDKMGFCEFEAFTAQDEVNPRMQITQMIKRVFMILKLEHASLRCINPNFIPSNFSS